MDTIVDVVVGSVGEEGRVAGSHDSIEDGAVDAEDDRSHAVSALSGVEWLVSCSSRLGSRVGLLPQTGTRDCVTNAMLPGLYTQSFSLGYGGS